MEEKAILPKLLFASFVVVFFLYLKFASVFLFRNAYYQLPLSVVTELAAIFIAYLLVEMLIKPWKISDSKKLLLLAALLIVPLLLVKYIL